MPGGALVNIGDPELEYAFYQAERRVLGIQAKLHRWARDDPHRRFDDLFNLVCDPAFLLVAWVRVRSNKGARSAGVDGFTASATAARGVGEFLDRLRSRLKDRSFQPVPVRERMIPKAGGKKRRLGIAIASGLRSLLPGLGISTFRAGNGRQLPSLRSLASSPSSRVTPYSSTSARVVLSMPGAPLFRRTATHARHKTSPW